LGYERFVAHVWDTAGAVPIRFRAVEKSYNELILHQLKLFRTFQATGCKLVSTGMFVLGKRIRRHCLVGDNGEKNKAPEFGETLFPGHGSSRGRL